MSDGADAPPPEEAPPKIDDRRRYPRLWKEVLVARLLPGPFQGVGLVVALFIAGAATFELSHGSSEVAGFSAAFLITGTLLCAPILALPTLVAKRGVGPYFAAAGAVAAAGIIGTLGVWVTGAPEAESSSPYFPPVQTWLFMMFAVSAGAVGLVEGLYERSIATTYCGLIGGALSGYLAAASCLRGLGHGVAWILAIWPWGATLGNVGIGLSLALGRYIRDLPKRREKSDGEASSE